VLHHRCRYWWQLLHRCPNVSGGIEASNVLSFGTAIIGFEGAWGPVAADYGVYIRSTTKDTKSFGYAYGGVLISQLSIELLGAALGTLAASENRLLADSYSARGIGGLVGAPFRAHGARARGFGKFVEVLLGVSCVAVITTNIYSLGLSDQMITPKLLVVPRMVWSLIGSVIFMAGLNRTQSATRALALNRSHE